MSFNRLNELLKDSRSGQLGSVLKRAREMDILTEKVRSLLSLELAENLESASLRDSGELVLLASSSAWAARLRFEATAVLETLRDDGLEADRCRVRVRT